MISVQVRQSAKRSSRPLVIVLCAAIIRKKDAVVTRVNNSPHDRCRISIIEIRLLRIGAVAIFLLPIISAGDNDDCNLIKWEPDAAVLLLKILDSFLL